MNLSHRPARLALAVLAAVAALEWFAAASAYRARLTPEVWQATALALATLPPGEPVYLGTPWLGPSARQHLPPLRGWDSLAAPDLHGVPRFHVLGMAGSHHAGAWSDHLQTDLAELPPPQLLASDDLGPLRLHHYLAPAAGVLITDWLADPAALTLRDARGPCRLSSGTWSCKQGSVALATREVAYRPRRCLALDALLRELELYADSAEELGAVLGAAAGFGRDQPRPRHAAAAHLVAADRQRLDRAGNRRLAEPTRARHALAEPDNARERIDDAESLRGRPRHQQAAVVGAEVARGIGGAGRCACAAM